MLYAIYAALSSSVSIAVVVVERERKPRRRRTMARMTPRGTCRWWIWPHVNGHAMPIQSGCIVLSTICNMFSTLDANRSPDMSRSMSCPDIISCNDGHIERGRDGSLSGVRAARCWLLWVLLVDGGGVVDVAAGGVACPVTAGGDATAWTTFHLPSSVIHAPIHHPFANPSNPPIHPPVNKAMHQGATNKDECTYPGQQWILRQPGRIRKKSVYSQPRGPKVFTSHLYHTEGGWVSSRNDHVPLHPSIARWCMHATRQCTETKSSPAPPTIALWLLCGSSSAVAMACQSSRRFVWWKSLFFASAGGWPQRGVALPCCHPRGVEMVVGGAHTPGKGAELGGPWPSAICHGALSVFCFYSRLSI